MSQSTKNTFSILSYGAGLVCGILLTVAVGWKTMPGMMISTHQSKFSTVEETCAQLVSAIEEGGWSTPATRDMNKAVSAKGLQLDRNVKVVELCKADYAKDVLETDPQVSTLMPCAWGVYEGDDGAIYISGMNMGLMGKMFGGNIAKVMGGNVSVEERTMLAKVISEQ